MTLLRDQSLFGHRGDGATVAAAVAGIGPLDAPWDEVAASLSDTGANGPADKADETALIASLLAACRIPQAGPQMG